MILIARPSIEMTRFVIPATQKKLREAQFFFRHVVRTAGHAVRNDPEEFDFLLSAFLSAARSVTFALQKEAKAPYEKWFPQWKARRGEAECALLDFMKEQRNVEQKEGGVALDVTTNYVPMRQAEPGRSSPYYGFQWRCRAVRRTG